MDLLNLTEGSSKDMWAPGSNSRTEQSETPPSPKGSNSVMLNTCGLDPADVVGSRVNTTAQGPT